MIKYNPKNWFGLIFEFHKSDTLRKLVYVILIYAVYAGVIVYLELHYTNFKSTIAIHSLLGFVLGLLLVPILSSGVALLNHFRIRSKIH